MNYFEFDAATGRFSGRSWTGIEAPEQGLAEGCAVLATESISVFGKRAVLRDAAYVLEDCARVPPQSDDPCFEFVDDGSGTWSVQKTDLWYDREGRSYRERLMTEVGNRQLRAMRLGVQLTAEESAYVQALADVTGQEGWPREVSWPTRPW